ncbi:hypothetical protein Ancab_009545 [Ancistrocladus abbreviatus]
MGPGVSNGKPLPHATTGDHLKSVGVLKLTYIATTLGGGPVGALDLTGSVSSGGAPQAPIGFVNSGGSPQATFSDGGKSLMKSVGFHGVLLLAIFNLYGLKYAVMKSMVDEASAKISNRIDAVLDSSSVASGLTPAGGVEDNSTGVMRTSTKSVATEVVVMLPKLHCGEAAAGQLVLDGSQCTSDESIASKKGLTCLGLDQYSISS